MSLLDKRLNIVMGKGGVGKSTLTAVLALAAQKRGRRVLCCEVTAQERVAGLLDASDSGTDIHQIDKSIWSVHIRPEEAMKEYGLMVLRFKALYSAVFENRLVRYFTRAVPSLPEIVMLGKIWWHVTQELDESGRFRWDNVIIDAPATGHGISFMRTPQNILDIVDDGPMVRDMKAMQALIMDPTLTAVSLVALPEEMPANEAIELHAALSGFPMGRLFLNAYAEQRFQSVERDELAGSDSDELGTARASAKSYGVRQDLSALYKTRLQEGMPLPMTLLPFLAGPTFGRAEIQRLATLVESEI